MAIVVLLLIVVPIIELYVFVQVAHAVGFGVALLALVLVSVFGGWVVKREGIGVWRRLQEQLGRNESPGREVLDGILLLAAGVFILAPGFVTDAIGLLLLVPPIRALVCTVMVRRYGRSPHVIVATYGGRIVDTSADEGRPPRSQLEP
jgi:UPF0716 protein FxsA